MPSTTPAIRRGDIRDASTVAELWLQSFRAALPSVRLVHSDDEVRRWIRDEIIEQRETWVVCVEDEIAGMMTLSDASIDQLYLAPSRRGQGLGDLLVTHAKTRYPSGLGLWTFQVNSAAVRFYRRHGFREKLRTDGAHNEEREPDVRMEWTPPDHEHASSTL